REAGRSGVGRISTGSRFLNLTISSGNCSEIAIPVPFNRLALRIRYSKLLLSMTRLFNAEFCSSTFANLSFVSDVSTSAYAYSKDSFTSFSRQINNNESSHSDSIWSEKVEFGRKTADRRPLFQGLQLAHNRFEHIFDIHRLFFVTGFLGVFDGVFVEICAEFVLTLMKLRLNMPFEDLAYRFGISVPTVSRIFLSWMIVMDVRLSPLIKWPEREDLWRTMPQCFQFSFGHKTTVIIDCFEVFIDRPSNLLARAQTYSSYKSHNTVKVLIGITPQGTISFGKDTIERNLTLEDDNMWKNHCFHNGYFNAIDIITTWISRVCCKIKIMPNVIN
ncbi:partial, partial [Paramuricea clavata]